MLHEFSDYPTLELTNSKSPTTTNRPLKRRKITNCVRDVNGFMASHLSSSNPSSFIETNNDINMLPRYDQENGDRMQIENDTTIMFTEVASPTVRLTTSRRVTTSLPESPLSHMKYHSNSPLVCLLQSSDVTSILTLEQHSELIQVFSQDTYPSYSLVVNHFVSKGIPLSRYVRTKLLNFLKRWVSVPIEEN